MRTTILLAAVFLLQTTDALSQSPASLERSLGPPSPALKQALEKRIHVDLNPKDKTLKDLVKLLENAKVGVLVETFERKIGEEPLPKSWKQATIREILDDCFKDADQDWTTIGDVVVVNRRATIERLRARLAVRLERRKEYSQTEKNQWLRLTIAQYIETRIGSVLAFLEDPQLEVVRLNSSDTAFDDISLTFSRHVPYDVFLDLLAAMEDADWEMIDSAAVFGTHKQITEIRKRTAASKARREQFPQLAEALATPIRMRFTELPIKDFVDEIVARRIPAETTGKMDEKLLLDWSKKTIPLDAMLDQICVRYDLAWEIVDGKIRIRSIKSP